MIRVPQTPLAKRGMKRLPAPRNGERRRRDVETVRKKAAACLPSAFCRLEGRRGRGEPHYFGLRRQVSGRGGLQPGAWHRVRGFEKRSAVEGREGLMPFRKGRISHLSDPYVSAQMELCRELSGKADTEHPCGGFQAGRRQTDSGPGQAPRRGHGATGGPACVCTQGVALRGRDEAGKGKASKSIRWCMYGDQSYRGLGESAWPLPLPGRGPPPRGFRFLPQVALLVDTQVCVAKKRSVTN